MVGKVRTINRDLFVRRCLACGYDGALLRGGYAERCALCGCDLRERPARSYAEMEGIVGRPITVRSVLPSGRRRNMIQRWLTFLVLVLVGLGLLVYLGREAMP